MSNNTGGPAFPTERIGMESGEYLTYQEEGMTLRQYAAIKLRVPSSGTDWLDELIAQSLRDEFAAKAMQGYLASYPDGIHPEPVWVATNAYQMADAMLKAREQ